MSKSGRPPLMRVLEKQGISISPSQQEVLRKLFAMLVAGSRRVTLGPDYKTLYVEGTIRMTGNQGTWSISRRGHRCYNPTPPKQSFPGWVTL